MFSPQAQHVQVIGMSATSKQTAARTCFSRSFALIFKLSACCGVFLYQL
jgi:hypothetical protein